MTMAQWMFHFREIQKFQQKRDEELYTFAESLFTIIERAGTLSHPEMKLDKILQSISERDAKKNASQNEDIAKSMSDYVNSISEIFPETLSLKVEPKKETQVKKARIDKKRGIIIPLDGGEI